MSKNTIQINGEKLRSLLEKTTGKTVYQIAEDQGFSRNLLAEAIRKGKASPIIQSVAKIYGIAPGAYELKDPEPEEKKPGGQISIYELVENDREELKNLIKESVLELFDKSRFGYDEKTHRLLIAIPYENIIISKKEGK